MAIGKIVGDMQAWYDRNMKIHGWALFFLAGFVYFGQGGRGYLDSTIDWVMQYSFNEDSAKTEAAKATGKLPWNFKFLIGLISDNFPLFGYNIKPYMWLACVFGAVAICMMASSSFTPTATPLTLAYIVVQFYGATVDCLSDALVVKSGQNDEEDSSSGLQSISWFSLGVGGALFTIIGGEMATDDSGANDGVNVQGARNYCWIMMIFPVGLIGLLFFVHEKRTNFRPSPKAFLQQLVRLFVALFSPPFLVLRVATWIVLSSVSNIRISSALNAYKTTYIDIPPNISGYIDASSYLFLSIGVVLYYRFFRHTAFRKIFVVSQVLYVFVSLSDYVLIRRWNKDIGLPDVMFLVLSSVFTEVVDRLNAMPFLVMAAQLCPNNMEATFFSAMMSISNTGGTMSQYLGSRTLKYWEVSKDNFDNLGKVILFRTLLMVLVIAFVFLLPNTSALSPSNVETLKPTNPTIIRLLKWADLYNEDDEDKVEVKEKA